MKVACPYCHKEFDYDITDCGTDVFVNEEPFTTDCPNCGMVMLITPVMHLDLEVEECDCQGVNHKWQPTNTMPKCFTKMECVHCHEERNPTPEEKIKYNIPSVEEYSEYLKRLSDDTI